MPNVAIRSIKHKLFGLAIAGSALCSFGTAAKAVIILPGQDLPTTGVTAVSGPAIYSSGNIPFTGTDAFNDVHFTGILSAVVYQDVQGLDFVYQFTNNANSPDPILHFSSSSFTGYITDSDYLAGTGSGTAFPTTTQRDAANGGDTIDFDFPVSSAVLPGLTSDLLVIKTNATSFTPDGTVSLQDGGNVSFNAPAPIAVPEPASIAMAGFALCALGLRRRNVPAR